MPDWHPRVAAAGPWPPPMGSEAKGFFDAKPTHNTRAQGGAVSE